MNEKTNSRATAADIVARWLGSGEFPERLIDEHTADRAFVMEVVRGVARWKRLLEWVTDRCVKGKAERRAVPYLLIGLYQILLMDTVADHAAVNETVEAAKTRHGARVAGFVNGVLRHALREEQNIRKAIESLPLGVRESHPDALVNRWLARLGETAAAELCRWNNTRPELTIRPNLKSVSVGELVARFREAGFDAAPHPAAGSECLVLRHGARVDELPGYKEGLFSVQDPSTFAAVRLLDPRPGELILDACAAPGGKTILIADRMAGTGAIVAMDAGAERIGKLKDNVRRMQLGMVEIVHGDLMDRRDMDRIAAGRLFDRILLDVPCTNTGVLRRRPDARWRFTDGRLRELVALQRSMLDSAAGRLKPGGLLVYSTCSLEPEECDGLISKWLSENAGFFAEGVLRTVPPADGMDGAFAAALLCRGLDFAPGLHSNIPTE